MNQDAPDDPIAALTSIAIDNMIDLLYQAKVSLMNDQRLAAVATLTAFHHRAASFKASLRMIDIQGWAQ